MKAAKLPRFEKNDYTYIAKVKEKNDREETIAMDIKCVHWLDLVST